MRIRSIKPEFWRSDDVAALSIEDRLLFIGLWSYVDDSGIGVDKTAHICADLFAPDLEANPPEVFARVTGGLQNLAERGLILRYEADGKPYLYVTNWEKHQRIDKPSKRRFPTPDEGKPRSSGGSREDSGRATEKVAPGTGEQGNRGTGEQKEVREPPARSTAVAATTPRPEIDKLCELLADRIEANGSKRPTITKRWEDACRLMIDRDDRTPEQVAYLINWSQAHNFWQSNILSMPKLREKFDQLRLQATSSGQSKSDQRAENILRMVQNVEGGSGGRENDRGGPGVYQSA